MFLSLTNFNNKINSTGSKIAFTDCEIHINLNNGNPGINTTIALIKITVINKP